MPPRLGTALIAALVLVSLWTFGAISSAREVKVPLPNVRMILSPSVTPGGLPRAGAIPIALEISGQIETLDGSRPPAVEEFALDLDRGISIDGRGLPACQKGLRDLRFPYLKSRCKGAIVGRGRVGLQIQFPEQPPASTESELIVFNGGNRRAGKTTLYASAFITQPITSAFTMEMTIAKVRRQSRVTIKVPGFANGAGSLTDLNFGMKKRFTRNGRVVDFLTGRCPDGTLQSHVSALFVDGTTLTGDALQKCGPKSA
jgi:hypothetical protein